LELNEELADYVTTRGEDLLAVDLSNGRISMRSAKVEQQFILGNRNSSVFHPRREFPQVGQCLI
jgi:hypothetical protein